MNQLIPSDIITEIVGNRDYALREMEAAVEIIAQGHARAEQSKAIALKAHEGAFFALRDDRKTATYQRLFIHFDAQASLEVYRQQLDSQVWMHLMARTGANKLMDRTQKNEFWHELRDGAPEVTEKAIRDFLMDLAGDADLIFRRGLARVFGELDRRFKSHDAFKIGARIVLTNIFDDDGHWNYHSNAPEVIADVERSFAILDGKTPQAGLLKQVITEDRGHAYQARQSISITPYFKVRTYKNGNCHLWLMRDDLVLKANELLADYYGAVLPDSVPEEDPSEDLKSKSGALSKDLAFYPTPKAVVHAMLNSLPISRKGELILEHSAGTGNIVRELLAAGANVKAVEVHPERFEALESLAWKEPRLEAMNANFLSVDLKREFTAVVMNPPFYGTHWMQHVVKAYGLMVRGGILVAVLPISAELGQTAKHKKFRAWAKKRADGYTLFCDLPQESFVSSGTRVNTVILALRNRDANL